MKYLYSLIRFVPDPATGEFVVIGAIAGSDTSSEWELRTVGNWKRARAIDASHALVGSWDFVVSVERLLDAHDEWLESNTASDPGISEEWLMGIHRRYRGIVQLSRPMPISAESSSDALDFLFDHVLAGTDHASTITRPKTRVLAALRQAYRGVGLQRNAHIFEKTEVRGDNQRTRMDFTVANGHVVQLTQAWSFVRGDESEQIERIKAWAYAVKDFRQGLGAVAVIGEREIRVPRDVDIEVVVAPSPQGATSATREAQAAFDDVGARTVLIDAVQDVSHRAYTLLAAQGVVLPLLGH